MNRMSKTMKDSLKVFQWIDLAHTRSCIDELQDLIQVDYGDI